ncbi:MAG: 6-phosphogluconolactonase [Candidatus Hydrogenedentes bacterium]|nr:6-phosphogluconolactonase [Candidatus Hydrogenedentota bacterium]
MSVFVSESPAREAAAAFATLCEESIACLNLAVSGGSTPRALFRLLATEFREHIPWQRVAVFQVDERCVPPTDSQSNWKMLHEELLAHVPNLTAFRMEAERPRAAEDYERVIRDNAPANEVGVPRFDLILLGMGADGHTASLFPGTDALSEERRLVVLNAVPQLSTERITMTYPLINAAARRWFLVQGADKAPAYARIHSHGDVPAALVADADWFVDASVVGAK